jgi:hypothetical protein
MHGLWSKGNTGKVYYVGSLFDDDYLSGIWLAPMVDLECVWNCVEKLELAAVVGELCWWCAKCPEP